MVLISLGREDTLSSKLGQSILNVKIGFVSYLSFFVAIA